MDRLLQDLRYAARLLRKSPGFTLAATLTLAVGIGANTAMFSLVNGLLLRPLPLVEEPDRLVAVYTSDGGSPGVSSYMDYRDFRDRMGSVLGLAAYKPRLADLSTGGVAERVQAMLVTGNYFEILGIEPAAGRLLAPRDDEVPDAHALAVISHGLWTRRFAADPDLIGGAIHINGREFAVLGVTPPGFRGTWLESGPDVYVPLMMQAHMMPGTGSLLDNRGWGGILMLGRLAPEQSTERARAELESTGEWISANFTESATRQYHMVSMQEGTLLPEVRGVVVRLNWLLMAMVGLVLLVACVNVANLLLARATTRKREIALRQALGAGRSRIVVQLLAESLLLGLMGGVAGVLVGAWGARLFQLIPLGIEIDTALDGRVLLFALVTSLGTGLLFGLAPAWRATGADLVPRLRSGGTRGRSGGQSLVGRGLVVAQVALSILLLVAAGLFARTLINLQTVDLGFEASSLAAVGVNPALQGYTADEIASVFTRLVDSLGAMPGVTAVSYVNSLPGPDNDDVTSFAIEGYEPGEGDPQPRAYFNLVGPGYFPTVGIPLVRGRGFGPGDDQAAPLVAVVNETLAGRFEGATGRSALRARVGLSGPGQPMFEIVGVAADSKTGPLRAAVRPTLYLPQLQALRSSLASRMMVVARTSREPATIIPAMRAAVQAIDPTLPTFDALTVESHLSSTLAQERLSAMAILIAAALALALALVGLYGLLAYSVSRRTGELGIRMALGARAGDVVRLVLNQGLLLVGIGLVIGLSGAAATSRLLAGFLYGIEGLDPAVYAGVAVLLAVVALIAAWVPARRATRVDPVVALRVE